MVVVDGGRKLMNRAVDIVVTSVHQTTAGKMIFGKPDERIVPAAPAGAAQAAPEGREPRASEGAPSENAPRPVFPESSRSQS